MPETEEDLYTWDWLEDPEEAAPDYENASRIKFNMRCDIKPVMDAAQDLAIGLEGYPEQAQLLEERIDELEQRLEIIPITPYDGIYCRDITISLQEKRLDKQSARIKEIELLLINKDTLIAQLELELLDKL